MTRLLVAFAVAASFAVVSCFFVALVNALPVPEVFVVVIADAATPVGQPWAVRVQAIDEHGAASFVGAINTVRIGDGPGHVDAVDPLVRRLPRLDVDGSIGDHAFVLSFDVPVVAADAGWTLRPTPTAPAAGTGAGLLPLHDGLPRARLVTTSPQPGDLVVVKFDDTVRSRQLLVGGRLAPTTHGALRVPRTAKPGDLVVVSVADTPWPSGRARTLVTFVGGPQTQGLDDDDLARVVPARALVGNIAPPFDEQRRARQAVATAEAVRWRSILRLVDAGLLLVVAGLALSRLRQTPVAAAGAFVVVAALLGSLDLVLGFVS